ncbi:LOW QUALITY PROTEIN: DDE_4 domain-containing protein, partial [Cephalotus follicularis]
RAQAKRLPRDKDNASILSGNAHTLELLRGSDRQCIELMRMSWEAYVCLCMHFRHKLLHDSRHVSVEVKMIMFLTIIGHNERYVVIKRKFQHSSQTIHKYFHEVLVAMMTFAREMIVPSTFDPNPYSPRAHKSLRRIFNVFHYPIPYIFYIIKVRIRNMGKGKCYQNVLGICDFNMIFTFVYAGWEWLAHDPRVYKLLLTFIYFMVITTRKYSLCDAAYTNTRGFMAPYRNVRRAMTKEEKFNHTHAKLRNVIERAYGVLNARFPIFDKMAPYPFNVQRNIVIVCFAVNNFIRKVKINDELFAQYEEPQMVAKQVGQEEEVDYAIT